MYTIKREIHCPSVTIVEIEHSEPNHSCYIYGYTLDGDTRIDKMQLEWLFNKIEQFSEPGNDVRLFLDGFHVMGGGFHAYHYDNVVTTIEGRLYKAIYYNRLDELDLIAIQTKRRIALDLETGLMEHPR